MQHWSTSGVTSRTLHPPTTSLQGPTSAKPSSQLLRATVNWCVGVGVCVGVCVWVCGCVGVCVCVWVGGCVGVWVCALLNTAGSPTKWEPHSGCGKYKCKYKYGWVGGSCFASAYRGVGETD